LGGGRWGHISRETREIYHLIYYLFIIYLFCQYTSRRLILPMSITVVLFESIICMFSDFSDEYIVLEFHMGSVRI
jgi:hypothetical protein